MGLGLGLGFNNYGLGLRLAFSIKFASWKPTNCTVTASMSLCSNAECHLIHLISPCHISNERWQIYNLIFRPGLCRCHTLRLLKFSYLVSYFLGCCIMTHYKSTITYRHDPYNHEFKHRPWFIWHLIIVHTSIFWYWTNCKVTKPLINTSVSIRWTYIFQCL